MTKIQVEHETLYTYETEVELAHHLAYLKPFSSDWQRVLTTQVDIDPVPSNHSENKDAFGNVLVDGDTITVIKDLKIKGSSTAIKVGTKVKNIRLIDGDHDIDCKIDGIGAMQLKSEFIKKA